MAQNHAATNNNMYIVQDKEMTYEDSEKRIKTSANPFGNKPNPPSSIILPQRHVGNFNLNITSALTAVDVTPKKRHQLAANLIASTNSSLND